MRSFRLFGKENRMPHCRLGRFVNPFPAVIVGDQPAGPVTKFWEQRFESVFVFPDDYRTILTWAAPLKMSANSARGQKRSNRGQNSNLFQSCRYAYQSFRQVVRIPKMCGL